MFNVFIFLATFQATLDHLESVIHMPSQQDFVQMTSLTNGEGLNGHHRDEQGWCIDN